MTEKYFFADPEKPFHFWVREGSRWVLRDGAAHLQENAHSRTPQAGRQRPSPQSPSGAA
jgi:hypothetical protein